jgi:S1-C subfamily serine protease
MNALDVIIILFGITALYRGHELGLTRQLFSTAGFFLGLLLGSFLQQFTVESGNDPTGRAMIALLTTLGTAFFFLAIGEHIGMRLKYKVQGFKIDALDRWIGSLVGAVTLLVAVWLSAAILLSLPLHATQTQIRGSRIVSILNGSLPPATTVIAGFSHLISPNGFPQVFTGNEPSINGNTNVPGISPQLQAAIDSAKRSVVKFEGIGCGGVVEGTGFVISNDLVATNAHVVAGVERPFVRDTNGQHSSQVIWFDPDLDFAIVRADNLAGPPLLVNTNQMPTGSQGAILGYPGGGPLVAGGAEVLDHFAARGRDIYNRNITVREVYSLAANIIPGNSGGPLIAEDGSVTGVIFAQSTVYENVGYALSADQITSAISQARAQNREVSNGQCAR